MKHRAFVGLAFGIVVLIFIVATHDMSAVARVLTGAGWSLSWVLMWRVLSIFASAAGWRFLFPVEMRLAYPVLVFGRWVAEAINHLLPALQIGGDVVRARLVYLLARRHGLLLSGVMTAAVQIVDITCALAAQVALVSIGFLQLWQRGSLALIPALFGISLVVVPLVLLLAVQRREVLQGATGILGKMGLRRFLQSIAETNDNLADHFRGLYHRRHSVAAAFAWHIAAGLLRVGETWSVLWAFGHPISLPDAMLVDVMTGAVRSLVFFIPGALGAQESGILLICSMVGIDPSLALALALAKRARDLILGLPGLGSWLITERYLLMKNAQTAPRP